MNDRLNRIEDLAQQLACEIVLEVHAGSVTATKGMVLEYVTGIISTLMALQEEDGIAKEYPAKYSVTGSSIDDAKKRAVLEALEDANGNQTEAARKLGITRKTLYLQLKRFGLNGRYDGRESAKQKERKERINP